MEAEELEEVFNVPSLEDQLEGGEGGSIWSGGGLIRRVRGGGEGDLRES